MVFWHILSSPPISHLCVVSHSLDRLDPVLGNLVNGVLDPTCWSRHLTFQFVLLCLIILCSDFPIHYRFLNSSSSPVEMAVPIRGIIKHHPSTLQGPKRHIKLCWSDTHDQYPDDFVDGTQNRRANKSLAGHVLMKTVYGIPKRRLYRAAQRVKIV